MNSSRPDLNLLVALEALLSERNVTRAAARLHLSQPALSAQLSRLRELFGDALLIPAYRGMLPTKKALELLAEFQPALDELRNTLASHRSFDPAKSKLTVSIACSDYSQWVVIVPLVLRLRSAAPALRVAVRALDAAQLEAQMARGEVDLALVNRENVPPALRFRQLFEERYVLIGRRKHPRLQRRLTLQDYVRLEHVMVSPAGGGFVTSVDDALAAAGLKRNVALSAASFLFLMEMVARSDFVALAPERLVRSRTDTLELVEPPLPVKGFSMGMVWHERGHGHPGLRWIREQVVAVANAGEERATARKPKRALRRA